MAVARTTARPAAAKAPTDHQPKKEKPKVEAIEGGKKVTLHGITVTVPDEALDDFELLDDLRAVQDNNNLSRVPALLRRLVGDDGYSDVMTALRPKVGRITVEAGSAFVMELFEALNPNS